MMTTETIKAPWTKEQVEALNRYQKNKYFHPYTCGNDHGFLNSERTLVATEDGWICPKCDYTQDWALSMSIDMADVNPFEGILSREEDVEGDCS